MNKNEVVVLVPHYNDTSGLIISLQSIDASENVDVLVVDDGSCYNKIDEEELKDHFKANGKMIFLYQEKNKGIEHALNLGLEYILKCDYRFVARLDSGDKCLSKRFNIQSKYLKNNPKIKLVGSNVIVNDTKGNLLYKIILPTDSLLIKNRMYITSTIIHPTIMFDKEIIKEVGFYPINYKAAEDYAFYFKILKKYDFSNINEFLLEKELSPNSISVQKRKLQAYNRLKVILDNFYFGYYPIFGLIRNFILLIVPNKILIFIKRVMK
ncbi:glycosyltransferase [Flavobacterium cucumis]|uniref:Glycosyl transferase family 2 n=1 Tax=Flavobacterium cucumis TaxID=416016 RepID=A0A1M7ZUY0_9FLAO|nr:glycosyltransferase [Flavobacterium cucumis]SHO72437.1 Glycosyl transferase family 2 [Flavobacterium cucumis]